MAKESGQGWSYSEGMERLWAEQEGASRRAGLSVPGIVTAAVTLADEKGLADVTMATLAGRLGFTTMALYRHIPNKAALQALMVDSGIGRPPDDFRPGAGWRERLEHLARTISATYRRHPWLLEIPISGPPATPNNLRWLDAGLVALRDTPLTTGEKISSWLLVVEYVRGHERITLELVRGAAASPGEIAYADVIRRTVRLDELPELARAVDEHTFDDDELAPDDADADFAFGLERLLDGIQVYIDAQSPGSTHRG